MALWAVGVAILVGYYGWAPSRAVMESVAEVKARWGFAFSAVSTAVAGGLLPVLIQQLMPRLPDRARLRHLPFFVGLWAYKGVETDVFYRLQAWVFGEGPQLSVMAPKLAVDMLIFTPAWGVLSLVVAYAWKDAGFSLRGARRLLGPGWFRERVVPVLISNWAVWFPAVCVVYALPSPLQIPIQNVVLCMWALMLMVITARSGGASPERG